MPGIDGGSKLSAMRRRQAEQLARAPALTMLGRTLRPARVPPKASGSANSTPVLDCAAPVRKLKPATETTSWTPGVAFKMSRTCFATSSVRSTEAPSGSCMTAKK